MMSSKRQRLEAGTSVSDNSNNGSPGYHAEAHITGLPDVPEGCFRKIVLFVGDASALHLCGANKQFWDLQPELKMLAIDPPHHSSSDYPRWIHRRMGDGFEDNFCVIIHTSTGKKWNSPCPHVSDYDDSKTCHDLIASLPKRHASTITHLFLRPILGSGHSGITASPESFQDYGTNLTSLTMLQVVHPALGREHPPSEDDTTENYPHLGDCLVKLCHAAASTLDTISIRSRVNMLFQHVEQILMREPPYINLEEEWSVRYDDLRQDPAELLRRKGRLENLEVQFWNGNHVDHEFQEEFLTDLISLASECG